MRTWSGFAPSCVRIGIAAALLAAGFVVYGSGNEAFRQQMQNPAASPIPCLLWVGAYALWLVAACYIFCRAKLVRLVVLVLGACVIGRAGLSWQRYPDLASGIVEIRYKWCGIPVFTGKEVSEAAAFLRDQVLGKWEPVWGYGCKKYFENGAETKVADEVSRVEEFSWVLVSGMRNGLVDRGLATRLGKAYVERVSARRAIELATVGEWRVRAASNPTLAEYAKNVCLYWGSKKGTSEHDPEVAEISKEIFGR